MLVLGQMYQYLNWQIVFQMKLDTPAVLLGIRVNLTECQVYGITRLLNMGFIHEIDLSEGIRRTIEEYRNLKESGEVK